MNNFDNISKRDLELLKEKYSSLDDVIEKINNNYPVQYLIGYVDFYGYRINVNENVLIPRFETEYLIEKTVSYLYKLNMLDAKIIDFGIGSGCISIALKKLIPSLKIMGVDISKEAISTAKENAKLNNADITFKVGDIFDFSTNDMYDVIISNPPYVPIEGKHDPKTDFEPNNSIYVEGNPLKYYEQIFKISKKILNNKYLLAFEIDEDESKNLFSLAKKYYPNDKVIVEKDLSKKDRYLFIMND